MNPGFVVINLQQWLSNVPRIDYDVYEKGDEMPRIDCNVYKEVEKVPRIDYDA